MHTRLVILTAIIVAALAGLSALGYHAVDKWAEGLEGARLGEFAEVAEQIRRDVKRKLDEFIETEQQRPYTDYLYYYVSETLTTAQQQAPVLRSPLGDQMSNYLAYGYFQIEPDGEVVTPYYRGTGPETPKPSQPASEVQRHLDNVARNVLPSLGSRSESDELGGANTARADLNRRLLETESQTVEQLAEARTVSKSSRAQAKAYPIESLQQTAQEPQIIMQDRSLVMSNRGLQSPSQRNGETAGDVRRQRRQAASAPTHRLRESPHELQDADRVQRESAPVQAEGPPQTQTVVVDEESAEAADRSDLVQIRVEPFVPIVVPGENESPSIFGGQVFLLRHVNIEDRHLLQGFQLDEAELIASVEESAQRFVRERMTFRLPQTHGAEGEPHDAETGVRYTAVLDFGFGDLIVDLMETDPAWIARRIGELRHIYFAIIATVVVAVALSLASLWHNVRAQVALAQKKDDFISAVSHELRTPLTSIRMYSEMLEKNWVKSPDKLGQYYRNMRQESERLSRLVENVLDFSRIQKGRKEYTFDLGDINRCVSEVVEMMRPYAAQHGLTLQAELGTLDERPFDRDAVAQIVVNLIDNAVKYAKPAEDKTIAIRSREEHGFAIIEVEDHGPGIPHRQRKRVFEQFYRCDVQPGTGERNRSQATGTGLGLALVKRFAEAHNGFVEILPAQPTGAILKVGLAAQA
jgi:signal transduction histidine kinase